MADIGRLARVAALWGVGLIALAGCSGAPWSLAQAAPAVLDEAQARRFLGQASFGPTEAEVQALVGSTRAAWLQQQLRTPATGYSGFVYADPATRIGCPSGSPATCVRDTYTLFPLQRQFFVNALTGPDQLRQRVALALSEILVTSGLQIRQPYAMAQYQRLLLNQAFGNYRELLRAVTLSPAMGAYLNLANNAKGDPVRGTAPNENYARELLQLFSIGQVLLNRDGTPRLDAQGQPIAAYDQAVVEGLARAFTGWTYPPRPGAVSRFPNPPYFEGELVAFEAWHDSGAKPLVGGVQQPAGQGAAADLAAALDSVFNHPNVGPFIGRQLIQHLVTANPSPAYVARVAAAFDGVGGGVRGDLGAVVRAILLDPEAVQPADPATFGKLRAPILQLTHLVRALGGQSDGVWLLQQARALGQAVYSPPTVFGFYAPDQALPDDPTLEGPTFGLYNANAAFTLSGVLSGLLSPSGVAADASVAGATGTRIDLAPWQALAGQPARLTAEINRLLFAGRMSPALQQAVTAAVGTQSASNTAGRARAALFLAVMSPEYLVEH